MTGRTYLLTGAAGDISVSLAEVLRRHRPNDRLVGFDVRPRQAPGPFDESGTLPRANDPAYLGALSELIAKRSVDTLIPGSEAELAVLLAAGWLAGNSPCAVIAANPRAVSIGLDKLETNRLLQLAGLPAPWTTSVGAGPPPALPCVLKPRRGQGSKGLAILHEPPAPALLAARADDVFQEYLPDDEAEFTCGLYRSREGEIRSVVLRRKLAGGLTGEAVVEEHAGIRTLLGQIAELVELRGSINVQLRLDRDVPKVFEINPRFSSTVGFRDRVGFCDLLWSLIEAEGGPLPSYAGSVVGTRYRRSSSSL